MAWSEPVAVCNPFFTEEFPSSLEAMGDALQRALASLEAGGWIDENQTFYARLCLEEALVNAIMHGNQADEARKVRLEMCQDGDRCHIRVSDEGVGFSVDNVHLPGCDEEGGRGICLIQYCMDEIRFDREKNCLEMTFHRKGLCCKGGEDS